MPTDNTFQEELDKHAVFKTEDPSQYYQINSQHKLGQGGYGKVFRVTRKSDGKKMALKFIQNLKDEKDRQLMFNEVGLMNMCKDNNIVLEVIDSYDYKGCLWIFVELMDGGALTQIIEKFYTTYSENAVRYMLKETLEGLKYLHNRHIIHRDIKSDNILVDQQGNIKLADFGYSAQLTQQRDARSSKVGTLCWMAPELIAGERRYDTKVDIWSVGVFAMELADGNPPYIEEQMAKVVRLILKNETPPFTSTRWSADFQDFVNKCMIRDPNERPSAEELLKTPFMAEAGAYKAEFAKVVRDFITLQNAEKRRRKK